MKLLLSVVASLALMVAPSFASGLSAGFKTHEITSLQKDIPILQAEQAKLAADPSPNTAQQQLATSMNNSLLAHAQAKLVQLQSTP